MVARAVCWWLHYVCYQDSRPFFLALEVSLLGDWPWNLEVILGPKHLPPYFFRWWTKGARMKQFINFFLLNLIHQNRNQSRRVQVIQVTDPLMRKTRMTAKRKLAVRLVMLRSRWGWDGMGQWTVTVVRYSCNPNSKKQHLGAGRPPPHHVPIPLLAWSGGGKELAFWPNYLGRIVQVAQVQCLATHDPVAAVRAIAEEFREALGVRNPYARCILWHGRWIFFTSLAVQGHVEWWPYFL
jgi:hypothetical protein